MTSKRPRLLSVSVAIIGLLGGAAPSGLLVPGAEAQAAQPVWRRREEEDARDELLLVVPPDSAQVILASHRSHSSHSSHSSHYSGSGGGHSSHASHSSHYSSSGGGGSYVPQPSSSSPDTPTPRPPKAAVPPNLDDDPPASPPKPSTTPHKPADAKPHHPPRPATVSFVAYPGGRIFVDGKSMGQDATARQEFAAGKHVVRVENRFLGNVTVEITLSEGQTGDIKIEW
jgi:hypothetical protein